ncbi:hypothetical protein Egran_02221 [Elaphomyces granulatus]|uniref:Tachykinin family protein n=1 Tax=Elaphomyces granulatus TaxID=519963 RepID=A0A232M0X4_9EURO|nr:hypothetical protein Egran_02221 [Elaphomyces granulatus]
MWGALRRHRKNSLISLLDPAFSHSGANTKTQAPSDRPSFTFIDHDDDLASKRIKNANARKTIRSHVMRDVRRRERLAGFKRVSKREDRVGASDKARAKSRESTLKLSDRTLPRRSSTPSSTSGSSSPEIIISSSSSQRSRSLAWSTSPIMSSPTEIIPPVPRTWFFDPFCALPGAGDVPSMVQSLVHYCASVYIPMTFPTETKISAEDDQTKLSLMGRTAFTDPGTFFGLMSVSAAHRAIVTGRHSDSFLLPGCENRVLYDSDYYLMKARCIHEMNAKLKDPVLAISNEAFGTIINLLTSAMIVGLFNEARMHLKGLKRMVDLRGGITDDSVRKSIMLYTFLTSDVKSAAGLMTRPVFPLFRDHQAASLELRKRLALPSSSNLNTLGVALLRNSSLSQPFMKVVHGLRDLMIFQHFSYHDPKMFSGSDRELLFKHSYEVEHEILSYPYRSSDGRRLGGRTEFHLHPVESVARVASICYTNQVIIVSPPGTGLGRALTKQIKTVLAICTQLDSFSRLSPACHDLIAWALFIGAQGALGQSERPWFVHHLAEIVTLRGWTEWEKVTEIMAGYFYIPYIHDVVWRPIWDEVMDSLTVSELSPTP